MDSKYYLHPGALKHVRRDRTQTKAASKIMGRLNQHSRRVAKQNEPQAELSASQKRVIARQRIWDALKKPGVLDEEEIKDFLSMKASEIIGLENSVSRNLFDTAKVTTSAVPSAQKLTITIKM